MAKESGSNLAAKRYALAAFELATQTNANVSRWADAIDEVAAFMSDTNVAQVLQNTRIDQASKQRLIDAALTNLPPQVMNLARLLVQKSRSALASEVAAEFRRLAEEREGISRVRARTAVPLTAGEQKALTDRLAQQTGRKIVLETEVDERLLGGVVVQIGDRLVDASVRHKLEALRENLEGAVQ